jgi:hypothetical protein
MSDSVCHPKPAEMAAWRKEHAASIDPIARRA